MDALRLSLGEARDERAAMAVTLFLMFASGTVLGLVGIPLSGYLSPTERLEEAAACATGLAACAFILFTWRRLPLWGSQVLLGVGTVVVSVGTLVASVRPTTTEMFYICKHSALRGLVKRLGGFVRHLFATQFASRAATGAAGSVVGLGELG
jgi:hypothetical protein